MMQREMWSGAVWNSEGKSSEVWTGSSAVHNFEMQTEGEVWSSEVPNVGVWRAEGRCGGTQTGGIPHTDLYYQGRSPESDEMPRPLIPG